MSLDRRVFPQLNEAEESEILAVCGRIVSSAGTAVVRKGDAGGDLFIVESGIFKVYEDEGGEEFVLALLNPGDVFGELSFLDGSPRSASVRAQSDGVLLKLERSAIPSLVLKNPYTATRLLFSLASIVSTRLRKADEALANLAFGQEEASCEELHQLAAEMYREVFKELSGHSRDSG